MTISIDSRVRPSLTAAVAGVPGAVETYLWLCDRLGKSPVYDAGWRHLPRWIADLQSAPAPLARHDGRVLMFSTFPFWTDYSLAVAILLVHAGLTVDVAWQPQSFFLRSGRSKGAAHWNRLARRYRDAAVHPRLRIVNLESVTPAVETAEIRAAAEAQAMLDCSYVVMKERIDVEGDANDRAAYEIRRARNLGALTRLAALVDRECYDKLLMPNGVILEFGSAYRYFSQRGQTVTTFELTHRRGTIAVATGPAVSTLNLSKEWAADAPHRLDPERRLRVERLMAEREQPAPQGYTVSYQHAAAGDIGDLRDELGLHPTKPLLLVCPNVPYDSVFYVDATPVFPRMTDWLMQTVSFLESRSECEVVVRCHPAEHHYYSASPEATVRMLRERFGTLPPHIHVIPPEAPVNTYALMRHTSAGIVYASTTGLEMAMRGIPVLCGSPSQHYNKKGFTIDPIDERDYFAWLDRFVTSPAAARPDETAIRDAWCYADVYFNQWPMAFPWHLGNLWTDLKTWPMSRVLSSEGQRQFEQALDALAATPTRP